MNQPPSGTFDICPVCYWEDDASQFLDSSLKGGANAVSLEEARGNFCRFGAVEERFVGLVRSPLPEERANEFD